MKISKVSICIPVYNGEKHLKETIESVVSQTYKNVEIIIQDNASIDETSEIIKSFSDFNNIFYERNDKLVSMAENWNIATSRASGEYLVLLSADDLLAPDFVEKCIEIFRSEDGLSVVSSEHYLLTEDGLKTRKLPVIGGRRDVSFSEILLKNPFSINFSMFKMAALKKSLTVRGGVFKEPYFTCDYDLWIRLAADRHQIYFITSKLATYRVHSGSLSSNKMKMIKHTMLVLFSNKKTIKVNDKFIYRLTAFRFFLRLIILYFKKGLYNKRLMKVITKELID